MNTKTIKTGLTIASIAVISMSVYIFSTKPSIAMPKGASEHTKAAHQTIKDYLPFENRQDFEDAKKGFIATLESRQIKDKNGNVVYDMQQFDFLKSEAPETVNPSLWRQSQINAMDGLYEVGQGVYQVRGFDLANMSFIRGKTGWIVIDPLTATETAKASYDLIKKHVEDLPVSAVIITHSHADHFGGVYGITSAEEIKAKGIEVIGPEKFFEESVNENLMAGNHMSRRASYMYGNLLPKSPEGTIGSGLGTTTATGTFTILEPTVEIIKTPTPMTVDGVKMIFMNTPGAEAPAELMFYMPEKKMLCQSEEINHTLHNLLTLRGAQVRNGLKWAKYIHETIELFGSDVETSFGSHHWPMWGHDRIIDFLKKQRDTYRYIHDETLRLANHGSTLLEVGDEVKLPDSLATAFANRGYYGTVNHNAKAQYQLYFGFFTGNPADLYPLPPREAGKKFVEYMGGANNVIKKAMVDYDKGEYRWVAQALNYVVFADPNNTDAKNLLAKTYDQMGYQAESGPWRNFYLTGAKELREGVKAAATADTESPHIVRNLNIENYLDYLAVRLNHPKAAGKVITMNFTLPDRNQKFTLYVENSVLNYTMDKHDADAHVSVSLDRTVLDDINLGHTTLEQAVKDGKAKIDSGDQGKLSEFVALLDSFELWFNIVTP